MLECGYPTAWASINNVYLLIYASENGVEKRAREIIQNVYDNVRRARIVRVHRSIVSREPAIYRSRSRRTWTPNTLRRSSASSHRLQDRTTHNIIYNA